MSLRQQPSSADQRNIIIATILIAVITFVWMWQIAPQQPPPTTQEDPVQDTTQVAEEAGPPAVEEEEEEPAQEPEELDLAPIDDPTLGEAQSGEAEEITIENDLFRAVFSTQGATVTSFQLKRYYTHHRERPVQLVDTTQTAGALSLLFTTPANHNIDSRTLFFEPSFEGVAEANGSYIILEDGAELTFEAQLAEGVLRKVYEFDADSYEVRVRFEHDNVASYITSAGYEYAWSGGVPFSEEDIEAEAMTSGAFARSGGDIVDIRLTGEDAQEERLSGSVDWTAVKSKYFTSVIMPQQESQGAQLIGEKISLGDDVFRENFTTRLLMDRPVEGQVDEFTLYMGPMEYYRITRYGVGLYGMVDYGWSLFEWMTRPLAQFVFIPAFWFLSQFIPNYGLVIIVLAILVKVVVYPLTKKSYKSMAKMRELQPRMKEIQEEYGDKPEEQQQEMVKLYKETGVNPVGGCLPMLLQYPIIIALWQFLPTSIEIRQQSFLWAPDLSVPDVILNLPFEIPFYGDFVAGFTILMGLSMVVQMRIQMSTTGTGSQMKALTYIFPVMIFVIFNRFASGLSLYYLTYNIVTAIQQQFINKSIEKENDDEELIDSNGEAKTREQILEERRKHRRQEAKS